MILQSFSSRVLINFGIMPDRQQKLLLIMIRPNVRQHIHNLKPRKKSKYEDTPFDQIQQKNTLADDLRIFQESLNLHKRKDGQAQYCQKQQEESLVVAQQQSTLDEPNSFCKNQFKHNHPIRTNFNRILNSLPFEKNSKRGFVSSDLHQYSSIHKTKVCSKPNTKVQKENVKPEQLINSQRPCINSTVACLKSQVLKQIKMANKNEASFTSVCGQPKQQAIRVVGTGGEGNMKQLQGKYSKATQRIEYLESKLKEKEEMAVRVDQIQKDLNNLIEENQQLLRINESLSRLPTHSEADVCDTQIQTDVFPLFVKDSFCQTIPPELESPQLINQNEQSNFWEVRFQKERLAAVKKQEEFRIAKQSIQIEHRLQVQRLQKQLYTLAVSYQKKCEQLRRKQEQQESLNRL